MLARHCGWANVRWPNRNATHCYVFYCAEGLGGGGPRVVVSTAAFHARVRGSVPGLGGLKETKLFLPHPRVKVSIVGSLRDREVACSASDRQGSNIESCVWRTVSSQSSHHPQEVLLAQFSLYVHKGGLKPDSFHFRGAGSLGSAVTGRRLLLSSEMKMMGPVPLVYDTVGICRPTSLTLSQTPRDQKPTRVLCSDILQQQVLCKSNYINCIVGIDIRRQKLTSIWRQILTFKVGPPTGGVQLFIMVA